ncbi:MAG: hypothetical protein WA949_21775 [Phormidesmis sp.]
MVNNSPIKRILILSANPKSTSQLSLDREVRDIAEGLKRSQRRDLFQLEQRWAVRPRDIQRALLEISPHVVHFSGHGAEKEGLIFEDESGSVKMIGGPAIAGLFKLFSDSVECVLLNRCYTQVQAEAIAQHIPYTTGTRQAISDQAAVEFAVGFYDALGADRSVEFAYKLACSAIELSGSTVHPVPVLIQQPRSVSSRRENLSNQTNGAQTNGARHRLEIEQQEIQNQLDALNEEIDFLQQSQETDDIAPKGRLLLQRQIKFAKDKRRALYEQMTTIENKL